MKGPWLEFWDVRDESERGGVWRREIMLLRMYFAFIEALQAIFSMTDKVSHFQSPGLLRTKMLIASDIHMNVK